MHQCCGLVLDRLGQMRVAVAKQVDRDAACKIKIALTALTDQIGPFAANRADAAPGINGHQRGNRHDLGLSLDRSSKKAAPIGRPVRQYCVYWDWRGATTPSEPRGNYAARASG